MYFGVLFWLLVLSAPVFYLVGLLTVIRWWGTRERAGREAVEEGRLWNQLDVLRMQEPEVSLDEAMNRVGAQTRLGGMGGQYNKPAAVGVSTSSSEGVRYRAVDVRSSWWDTWHQKHSIDLLLYLGAFLVVAAAVLFLQFQWQSYSGMVKALWLSAAALAFLLAGVIAFGKEAVKSAGATFLAIFGLLVPVCGAAWYVLVLAPYGSDLGESWLLISLVALVCYLILALYTKIAWYGYLVSAALGSVLIGMMLVLGLTDLWLVIAGAVCSLMLGGLSIRAGDMGEFEAELGEVWHRSALVLMPASLGVGALLASVQAGWVSYEMVMLLSLGGIFYIGSYVRTHAIWKSVVACGLTVMAFWLGIWWWMGSVTVASLGAILLLILLVGLILRTDEFLEVERDWLMKVLGILGGGIYMAQVLVGKSEFESMVVAGGLGIMGVEMGLLWSRKWLSYAGVMFGLGLLHLMRWDLLDRNVVVGMWFGGVGIWWAMVTRRLRAFGKSWWMFMGVVIGYWIIGMATALGDVLLFWFGALGMLVPWSLESDWWVAIGSGMGALIALRVSRHEQGRYWTVVSAVLGYMGIYWLLAGLGVGLEVGVWVLLVIALGIYGLQVVDGKRAEVWGVVGVGLVLLSGLIGYFVVGDGWRLGLLGFTPLVLWLEYRICERDLRWGYGAWIGLMVWLGLGMWELGIREGLWYFVLFGGVFAGIDLHQKKLGTAYRDRLGLMLCAVGAWVGLPYIVSVNSEMQALYSVYLLVMGLGLVAVGMSAEERVYRYGGIAGVLLSVLVYAYDFVLSLPRWVVVGGVGLVLLTSAVVLLKRAYGREREVV